MRIRGSETVRLREGEGLRCHGSRVTPRLQRKWCKTPCPFHVLLNCSLQWLSGDIQFWRPRRCVPNLCGKYKLKNDSFNMVTSTHSNMLLPLCIHNHIRDASVASEATQQKIRHNNAYYLGFLRCCWGKDCFGLASLATLPNIETWVRTSKVNNK